VFLATVITVSCREKEIEEEMGGGMTSWGGRGQGRG